MTNRSPQWSSRYSTSGCRGATSSRRAERVVRPEDEDVRGGRALVRDDDPLAAAGEAEVHVEALVVLLVDQHVVGLGGAQLVAPDLVGPHRVVGHGVEEVAAVGRPGRAVVGPLDHVGQVDAGVEIPDTQGEDLVAVEIRRPGEEPVILADVERADLEEGLVTGPLVLVEEDLLGGRLGAGATAVDGVRETLDRAAHEPPGSLAGRHALIGLLGAGLDLVEDGVDEVGVLLEPGVGVDVLGFEVGDRFRIVAVRQPGPRILDRSRGALPDVGYSLGDRRLWRRGHGGEG